MKTLLLLLPVACLVLMTGCGLEGPIPSGPKRDGAAPVSPPSETKPAAGAKAAPEGAAVHGAGASKSTAETKPGTIREKADVGAGEKGRGYGGDPISAALKARWSVEEKLTYGRIRQALDLYKAEKGQFPSDYEAFRKEILVPNNFKLPKLPEGDNYSYDPIAGDLMVEHTK